MTENSQKPYFHIAIDGPVASGKGTVSKAVAQKLGFLYVDTGAMYRATAYLAQQKGIDLADEQRLVEELKTTSIELEPHPLQYITVLLNGEDISLKIRTKEMDQAASKVSVLPEVRRVLVERQQKIAEGRDVIMEGRDITFKVLPKANLKIYLDADAAERAGRRLKEMQARHPDQIIAEEDVLKEVKIRDERDMGRSADPLQIVEGAWVLDTTKMSIDQVVEAIIARVRAMRP